MLGVILCGGNSSRMGTDKGLIITNGTTWARSAYNVLKGAGLDIVVSVNKDQLTTYKSIFVDTEVIPDDTLLSVKGPLRGILSVYAKFPDDLLVLATDMPFMNSAVITSLLNTNRQYAEAIVFKNKTTVEPLCAIYTSKTLSRIQQLVASNQLPVHSLKYVLSTMKVREIPVKESEMIFFRNFNYPQDPGSHD